MNEVRERNDKGREKEKKVKRNKWRERRKDRWEGGKEGCVSEGF